MLSRLPRPPPSSSFLHMYMGPSWLSQGRGGCAPCKMSSRVTVLLLKRES